MLLSSSTVASLPLRTRFNLSIIYATENPVKYLLNLLDYTTSDHGAKNTRHLNFKQTMQQVYGFTGFFGAVLLVVRMRAAWTPIHWKITTKNWIVWVFFTLIENNVRFYR